MLSINTIQSSLRIHRLPLHIFRHYHVSVVWNMLSDLHTVQYYTLSPPHSRLILHQRVMLLLPDPHPHCRHPRPHTHRHHWFSGQTYSALSPLHSTLIHHRLAMVLPSHPHPHRHHPHPHPRRHHWVPGQTSCNQLHPIKAGWRWGSHRGRLFHHIQLRYPCCPLLSRIGFRHMCNCCLSGCLGQWFPSQAPQAPRRRSNREEE